MNDSTGKNDDLNFEKVEFEAPESVTQGACFACARPLGASYFDINGNPACEPCKTGIENSMQGGSGMARLVKAVLFGTLAGIVGALIYFAIVKITGYEVGLVSILVGFMVGKAVFVGSGQRGGAFYQFLAIALTYVAIVSTYVPFILEEIGQYDESDQALEQGVSSGESMVFDDVPGLAGAEAVPAPDPELVDLAIESTANLAVAEVVVEQVGLLEMFVGLALMAGVLLALPFLAGMDNIIGLLIIGFGLYQAWSLNRKSVLSISGPFRIQQSRDWDR